MCRACDYTIHGHQHHFGWDNALAPAERVAPGSTILFHCQDSSAGQLGPSSTLADVVALDFSRINPVSGPIWVEGAEPGDALKVEIVRMTPNRATGWTRSSLAGNVVQALHIDAHDTLNVGPLTYDAQGNLLGGSANWKRE